MSPADLLCFHRDLAALVAVLLVGATPARLDFRSPRRPPRFAVLDDRFWCRGVSGANGFIHSASIHRSPVTCSPRTKAIRVGCAEAAREAHGALASGAPPIRRINGREHGAHGVTGPIAHGVPGTQTRYQSHQTQLTNRTLMPYFGNRYQNRLRPTYCCTSSPCT